MIAAQHALRLPRGGVRGLQLSATSEPEAACRPGGLHVPRLVAPYDAQAIAVDATLDGMRCLLDTHTSHAVAALEMERLE